VKGEWTMNINDRHHVWIKGYDYIPAEPGLVSSIHCPVCGQEMAVERDVNGATGYIEAMAGQAHRHDVFSCGKAREAWHIRARRLREEADTTASKKVCALIEEEIGELVAINIAAKQLKEGSDGNQ
jgi:hypothetical protein